MLMHAQAHVSLSKVPCIGSTSTELFSSLNRGYNSSA
jgi:hypothetical protein